MTSTWIAVVTVFNSYAATSVEALPIIRAFPTQQECERALDTETYTGREIQLVQGVRKTYGPPRCVKVEGGNV